MIGLMDCNNFFVSCERLFRPDLLKKPVAVLSSNDGCIVARSQEIKDLGIPMGVPYFQVKDICEEAGATLFSSNFTLYRDISTRVMQVLASEVGPCEIYSIDEAFFEIKDTVTAEEIKRIREKVTKDIGVPVSIGVSTTKTLAKQASSIAKKGNGVCILKGDTIQSIHNLPCSSVWGLGRQTTIKLRERGVTTIGEFLAVDRSIIRRDFGVGGDRIYSELQGIIVYAFGQNSEDIRQSITSSRSFEKTTKVQSEVESAVAYHVTAAAEKLRLLNLVTSRMYVTIQASRHGDFLLRKGTAEVVLADPTSSTRELIKEALACVGRMYDREVPYKKAGIVLAGLMPKTYVTGTLFEQSKTPKKDTASVDTITDSINEKFGHGFLHSGVIRTNAARASVKLRSKEYTTNWKEIPIACL